MPLLRRLALLGAVGLGAAVLAGPTFATARDGSLPYTVASTHFAVHYQTDPLKKWAITQTTAGDIATAAEKAYAAAIAAGFSAPPLDGALGGDSRIDIYVTDLSALKEVAETDADGVGASSSAYVLLDGNQPATAFAQHEITHMVFHVFEIGFWNSQGAGDKWIYNAGAEWMANRVDGYPSGATTGPDDMSLDCLDPSGGEGCNVDSNTGAGYSRWPFFEYLSEKYGPSFLQNVFAQGFNGATSATSALAAALSAKGTTLADTYDAWSTIELTGGYTAPSLAGLAPQPYAADQTGSAGGSFQVQVPVNHLATRFLALQRGDGNAAEPCYAATLTLTVAMPAGTSSKPTFFWGAKGSSPVPLTVNGSTATTSMPWDTCTWSGVSGLLALPNASTSIDAANFTVTIALTVDLSTPATATPPPAPVPVTTPVIPAGVDVAPVITVFGPELLRISASDPQLRLIVEANNLGSLQASIGSIALGSAPLRPGGNDIRFRLPKSLLASLRRLAGANVLTLTPVSPSGAVSGQPVTRTISITQPAVAPKPKSHKAKHP